MFRLPVLASLYLPLALAAGLSPDLLRAQDFLWPIGATLSVSAVAFGLAWLIRRRLDLAAVAAAWTVAAYSSLGAIVRAVAGPTPLLELVVAAVALCAVVYLAGLVALLATRRSLEGLVRYLTLALTGLLVWNAGWIAWRQIRGPEPAPPPVVADIPAPRVPLAPARDIYLIILDKYASSAALEAHFGFDNRGFDAALRARGFVVPPAARTNYVHTFLSVASMLNVRYLDELPARFGNDHRWELAYPLAENARLLSFLHDRGYRVVTFPSEFWATRENRYADLQLPPPGDIRPELLAVWRPVTAGPVLRRLACALIGCDADVPPPYLPATADVMDQRFRALGAIPPDPRPTFVFAHLLVPHEPYIYGPRCEHLEPFWPGNDTGQPARVRQAYLDQVRCTNAKVLAAVDAILAHARVPPIILIQGDHGHGRLGRDVPPLALVPPAAVDERTAAFAAYFLPGVPADSIAPDITPVSLMRFVLRHYFGADLPALADATYWSASAMPYRFERVP